METLATLRKHEQHAPWYDCCVAPLEWAFFRRCRQELLQRAQGQILEVAVGTGLNLPHYPAGCSVVAVDFSEGMMGQARKRRRKSKSPVPFFLMDAQHLAFKDGTFDTVVATLSLCTIPEPTQALREMARVCRPGGRLLLMDHVRGTNPVVGKVLDWLSPWQVRRLGCHLNRDALAFVRQVGLPVRFLKRSLLGILLQMEVAPRLAATGTREGEHEP